MKMGQLVPGMVAAALVTFGTTSWAGGGNPGILPEHSTAYGKTYAEWSATWWQWFLQLPWDSHPANPNAVYDVRAGQTGRVWFLASSLPSPAIEIPVGTALFIPLANAEFQP